MAYPSRRRRFFFSLPRDFIRRRRIRRRIANTILVPLLSIIAAYVITRPTGGTGFTLPKSVRSTAKTLHTAAAAPASDAAPAPIPPAAFVPPLVSPVITGGYKLSDGPYSVAEVQDIVLHDAKRGKDLHLRIFYPSGPGPYPVIVFSHGAGGSQACCDALTQHWASYGYVTLQPTHADSVSEQRDSGETDANFLKAVREALKEPALWESRPQDISFVLDSLSVLQNRIPALAGKLDAEHIGVGGHSMGAFTADAIAGALVDLPGHPATSFADPRVRAVLLLSPQGPGEFGLTDHSWDNVALPLLSVTGSLDRGANRQGPDWKKIPFDRSQPGDKYHVFIEGANHMSFITTKTLLPSRAAQGEAILAYTNAASLAFWDAYLKSDPAAQNYLRSDALPDFSKGTVKLFHR
jgi:predicted dienelactone hydrolase